MAQALLESSTESKANTTSVSRSAEPEEKKKHSEQSERYGSLKFRHYIPRSKDLRQLCLPKPTIEGLETTLEQDLHDVIEASLKEDVLVQINPKKTNWDLKRDVQRKLNLLSRSNDEAILKLIRLKIDASKDEQNLDVLKSSS